MQLSHAGRIQSDSTEAFALYVKDTGTSRI
jgi:hypothetical protein